MRWTLAQIFNTILISTIVISVAGSPIPLIKRKDDTVDIERREPSPGRAATSPSVKVPTRRRPAAPRAARTRPAVARPPVRRTPSTPGKRTPKQFPVRSPARRTPVFPRHARTATKAPVARRRTTPAIPRRYRSPVLASAARKSKVVKPLPASSIRKPGGKISRLSPQARLAAAVRTRASTQRRTGNPPTGIPRVPSSRTLSRSASVTKSARSGPAAPSSPKGLKSLRSAALVAGLAAKSKAASTKQTKGPVLCGRADDGPSCSIGGGPSSSSSAPQQAAEASRPPLDPNRPGPDRSITAKNIKEGRPDGWRSSPESKYLYFENADKTKAAWDEKTGAVVTVKEKPQDANVEHRVEAQAFAKAITDIKDGDGNQRYQNFKQLPQAAYNAVVRKANAEENVLYMSKTMNQKKGRAYTDAFNDKEAVVQPNVAEFVEFNKEHAATHMADMDQQWKQIQQKHLDWKVGDAQFQKTEEEASARISARP